MDTFGFITLNLSSENSYFTAVAKRAWQENIQCFRFTPTKIDPVTHLVSGEKFDPERNLWQEATFPIPHILYDRCFYQDHHQSRTARSIVQWLKKREDLTFLGHGLPNKWRTYEILSQSQLKPYIVKSLKPSSADEVLTFLNEEKEILLKPTFGSGGMGIVCLIASGPDIDLMVEKQQEVLQTTFPSKEKAKEWLTKLLHKKEYIAQPFLPLSDSSTRPFDLRLFLQKDAYGNWVERGRGLRIGQEQGILSNLRAGAKTKPFHTLLDTLNEGQQEFLQNEIDDIVSKLPVILEKQLPPPFELGIDIGIANDLSLWILDVNSKPGHKVVLETTPDVADSLYSAPIQYAKFLAWNQQKEGISDEKTISHRD